MKNLLCVLWLVFFFSACQKSEPTLEGKWKVNTVMPYGHNEEESASAFAALLWLNVFSQDAAFLFRNDSLYVDDRFQSTYKVKDQAIRYRDENGESRSLDHVYYHDTLILLSRENEILIKLLRQEDH